MRVLLIDDEQLDLFIAKKQLSADFEVIAFSVPREAIEWAKENSFEVALIDFYLGAQLGSEVLKAILALKEKNFKAFVLTNFVDPGQVLALKAEGFDDVIFKPLTTDKIKSIL